MLDKISHKHHDSFALATLCRREEGFLQGRKDFDIDASVDPKLHDLEILHKARISNTPTVASASV